MLKLFGNRYQAYVFFYQVLFILYLINETYFPKELTLIYLFALTLFEKKFFAENIKIFLFFGALALLSCFLFLYRQYFVNGTLIIHFFSLSAVVLFYFKRHIDIKIHKTLIILYVGFVVVQLIRGVDANEILMNRSRNMVSLYLLIFAILYYIEDFRYSKRIRLWPAILSLGISLMMIGRSGIISSSLLLITVFFFRVIHEKGGNKIKYILAATIVIGVAFVLGYGYLSVFLDSSLQRFSNKGLESFERDLIIGKYMELALGNSKNAFLGFSLDYYAFELFKFNLHNSYLSLHYFLGLFGIVLLVFLLTKILLKRGLWFYKCLLIVLLIRGYSDQIFFFNFNDVVIIYLIFLILYDESHLVQKKM